MEYFDICDEQGRPTGATVARATAHAEGIRHRTAHIWVLREQAGRAQVLLQKRSAEKDSFPGQYDTPAAGHIQAGDEPLESALRELGEELGIRATAKDLTFVGNFAMHYDTEFYGKPFRDREFVFVYAYAGQVDADSLTLQAEEVERVDWFDLEEVCAAVRRHDPCFCVDPEGLEVLRRWLRERGRWAEP